MHQALFIREILFDIFYRCSPERTPLDRARYNRADLVALATTCQVFKEPALDLLWERLYDLSPLVRCLPEACKPDTWGYTFSRSLSDSESETLRGYTRRVRFISQSHKYNDNKIVSALAPFIDPLFSNLQSLFWTSFTTLPVVHIAVPSLTSLHLSFQFLSTPHLPTEFLDFIGERCPNMRRFGVFHPRPGPLDFAISRQLCRWPDLQRADCRLATLSMDTVLHIPSVSTLERLSFTLATDLNNDITHLGSELVFSSLAYLEIRSASLAPITDLFARIQLPRIESLDVCVPEYTQKEDVKAFWVTALKACPKGTLDRLRFSASENGGGNWPVFDDVQGGPWLTWVDLLPCKDFGNLRHISINLSWSVKLTDADLLDLVSTSPRLEELAINPSWGWRMGRHGGGITLSGLMRLLRQCPFLHNMYLGIDTRTFTRIPLDLDLSFPPREKLSLDYLDSFIMSESAQDARLFLALRLGGWSSFYSDHDADAAEDSEDEE